MLLFVIVCNINKHQYDCHFNDFCICDNTAKQLLFVSGEIYYTDPLIQLTKSLVKHSVSLHNQLRY